MFSFLYFTLLFVDLVPNNLFILVFEVLVFCRLVAWNYKPMICIVPDVFVSKHAYIHNWITLSESNALDMLDYFCAQDREAYKLWLLWAFLLDIFHRKLMFNALHQLRFKARLIWKIGFYADYPIVLKSILIYLFISVSIFFHETFEMPMVIFVRARHVSFV